MCVHRKAASVAQNGELFSFNLSKMINFQFLLFWKALTINK